ncbi:hypothetical protein EDB85DRAFT_1949654 [Lactarius pseudohatsudake]|nr:hypothetical protein EDB85DRAFT_1949654 [Lactarius pseudohatsudake]
MLAVKGPFNEDRSAVAQLLVERGADANARDEDHKTPLHYASYPLEPNLLRILLDHGTNVDAISKINRELEAVASACKLSQLPQAAQLRAEVGRAHMRSHNDVVS